MEHDRARILGLTPPMSPDLGLTGGYPGSHFLSYQQQYQQQQQPVQHLNHRQSPVPNNPVNEYLEIVLGNKYRIGHKIGNGSFGEIFHAVNMFTKEDIAVKVEKKQRRKVIDPNSSPLPPNTNSPLPGEFLPEPQYHYQESRHSQLKREAKIYSLLKGEVGIPKIRWFGVGAERNWLVMDLLGRSLEDLFNYCNRKFTLKTVLVLAYELMCRIETVHTKGKLVHRDIKPENFLMGRGRDRHTVYIIDFGLAKLFQNPRTGRHISRKQGYSLTGTARYASVNAHSGCELSRRDDLISIGYVLVYFLKGVLPWQGLHGKTNEEKYKMIFQKKSSTSLEELCADLPDIFLTYFRLVTALDFDQVPDYLTLKNLFRELFVQQKYVYDNILYDWEVIASKGKR